MKKKILCLWTLIFIIIAIWTIYSLWTSNNSFNTSFYELELNDIEDPIRIIQISDLHNSEFGEDNIDLIQEIEELAPDLIFITGDIVDGGDSEREIALRLVEDLAKSFPVYFSYGNHDKYHESQYAVDFGELFAEAGAVVLDYGYVDVSIGELEVRIGGTDGYCLPERLSYSKAFNQEEYDFLNEFQDTERYKILLSHLPVPWIEYGLYKEWDVDLVFAGHTHGGQVVLPIIGGVYAPDFGWFPGRLWGVYDYPEYGTKVILSRGMGSSGNLIRFNNVPELVVVDIKTEG